MPYRVSVVDGEVTEGYVGPTWKPRMFLPFKSGSWARNRSSGSQGQIVVDTRDPAFKGTQRSPVWPWSSWIVIEWRRPTSEVWHLIYAGVITDARYDWATKELTLSHEDIWTILKKRIVTDDRSNDIAKAKVSWSGWSRGTLIKRILQNITNPFNAGRYYGLPLVFPEDSAGAHSLEVYGYNFETADDLIRDLIEDEDGPDIDFRPRWSSDGTLELVLEVNANKSLLWDYDMDVERPAVASMVYRLSGTEITNVLYGIGEGTEVRTLVRQSRSIGLPYPALEGTGSFSNVKSLERLQSLTTESRRTTDGAIRQLDMTVFADAGPYLSELRLGGSIRWKADKDTWLLSGWHPMELLGMSGNLTDEKVSLVIQSLEGRGSGV